MKRNAKYNLCLGIGSILLFILWTVLVMTADVKPIGLKGSNVGFATVNSAVHKLTGANMTLYNVTDWLGLVPILVCFIFAGVGLWQLIKRRSLFKVDADILILGVYYIFVIAAYLIFEMIPINYRPIFINGFMEVSYPSSTTLLVLCVMPTLNFQVRKRIDNKSLRSVIEILSVFFSVFMVVGRLISGVHWLSDIIGSVLISLGLFYIYKGVVLSVWNSAKNYSN
ncbi:MAG: phosphatase PAP2 family protein [Clostridia bacterium]|nr:phosphatase PAP2 family protein [Clostridia bacterium]MBQ4602148.1 phosphatase PAP2 family protein [Clostridia bacterium]